jgi:hypothetical protein
MKAKHGKAEPFRTDCGKAAHPNRAFQSRLTQMSECQTELWFSVIAGARRLDGRRLQGWRGSHSALTRLA